MLLKTESIGKRPCNFFLDHSGDEGDGRGDNASRTSRQIGGDIGGSTTSDGLTLLPYLKSFWRFAR